MTRYIAFFVASSLGIACGGTTSDDGGGAAGRGSSGSGEHQAGATSAGSSSGGTSSGGSSSGGVSQGGVNQGGVNQGGAKQGGANQGGVNQGGVNQGGANQGGVNQGGVSQAGGGQGGSGGGYDPRCPPKTPSGACADENLNCEYNPSNQCLCRNSGTTISFCQQVDPSCGQAAPPPLEGSGGFSAKVAVPPHQRCTCTTGSWSCVYGI